MKKEVFLEKSRNKHGYKYSYPTIGNIVMEKDVIDVQFDGVIYKQKCMKHLRGFSPEKKVIKKTQNEFLKECRDIWCDKYDYSLVEYKNLRTEIKIIYDGIVYRQLAISHLNGYTVEGYLDQDIFILKGKKKWGDKYDYSLVKFVNANTKVIIIYNGIEYLQTPHNHLKYSPERRLERKTNSEFINEAKLVHDDIYNYDKVEYINDATRVIINCKVHGDFHQTAHHHLSGSGCPNCNESKGEKAIAKFLNKNKITHSRQHKFKDCRNILELPFDFYIPAIRTCIEFDGKQHFEPMEFFGGLKAYESLKLNDKIKSDYCEDNYINLIRIKYDQYENINKILTENLSNYIGSNSIRAINS